MYRRCRPIFKATVLLFVSFLIVILFATFERNISIMPVQPNKIVNRAPNALSEHFTYYTEIMQSSPKLSIYPTMNLKTKPFITTEIMQSSPKLSIYPTVNLKTKPFTMTGGAVSVCPRKEIMFSSQINKLGTYPSPKRHLTIGISSITRPSRQNYLVRTVKRLTDSLSEEDRRNVFLVIFLADFDEALKNAILRELLTLFQTLIDQGLLHVIFAPPEYYPNLSNMKRKFGDSQERVKWRSKLVVDFSFLMCYCKDLSQYYLHLEDDLIPAPSFYPKLQEFITSQKTPWPILDAASMGHTAKVFHASDLENLATYFYLLYDEMPGDWLIAYWRIIKYDGQHKDFVLPHASFFQHIGDNSSLKENKISYKSKEKFFDQYDIKYRGLNPQARVSSSLKSGDGSAPEHAYIKGTGHFWAKGPKKDDSIVITFSSQIIIREVFVDTGSFNAPKDQLKSGILQASFHKVRTPEKEKENPNCKDFETVGHFKDGKLKVSLNERRKVYCLKILVTNSQSEWIFFREIDIFQS